MRGKPDRTTRSYGSGSGPSWRGSLGRVSWRLRLDEGKGGVNVYARGACHDRLRKLRNDVGAQHWPQASCNLILSSVAAEVLGKQQLNSCRCRIGRVSLHDSPRMRSEPLLERNEGCCAGQIVRDVFGQFSGERHG